MDQLDNLDAQVVYDYGRAGVDHPPGPAWLRRLFGDDFLADVVGVEVSIPRRNSDALAAITALPHLKYLVLHDGLDDASMLLLPGASELERLMFFSPVVTDAGISQLSALKQLTHLSIDAPHVTDTSLMLLEALPNLTYVELIGTEITQRGVDRLRTAMPRCHVRVFREDPRRLREDSAA